jgi:hypothetical protein
MMDHVRTMFIALRVPVVILRQSRYATSRVCWRYILVTLIEVQFWRTNGASLRQGLTTTVPLAASRLQA